MIVASMATAGTFTNAARHVEMVMSVNADENLGKQSFAYLE